jgi:hypothetical protein
VVPLPGRSAVYWALLRHGLLEGRKRRRRRKDYRRSERGAAMQLWQLDVMGRAGSGSQKCRKIVNSKIVIARTSSRQN